MEMTEETKAPKPSDPLTIEEMTESAELFFPRFNIVRERMPDGSTTEDTLKVMENIAKLGHQLRGEKTEQVRLGRFGFNKKKQEED